MGGVKKKIRGVRCSIGKGFSENSNSAMKTFHNYKIFQNKSAVRRVVGEIVRKFCDLVMNKYCDFF